MVNAARVQTAQKQGVDSLALLPRWQEAGCKKINRMATRLSCFKIGSTIRRDANTAAGAEERLKSNLNVNFGSDEESMPVAYVMHSGAALLVRL
jgi:hypothetical protein